VHSTSGTRRPAGARAVGPRDRAATAGSRRDQGGSSFPGRSPIHLASLVHLGCGARGIDTIFRQGTLGTGV
jgi:hypothetical protein